MNDEKKAKVVQLVEETIESSEETNIETKPNSSVPIIQIHYGNAQISRDIHINISVSVN